MDMSSHPAAAADLGNPRERIIAALHHRTQAAPAPEATASPPTRNLPALITALPGDETRAPQTEFTRARQVLFLENLSLTGSVRSAAAAGGVSHQTAYRARRATAAFRTAWDAALVAARRCAEDALANRAIDGVEEQVFYHGEVVATRRRYSDRLLLAHLARLDGLKDDPRAAAFAEDWDVAMARFAAGEAPVAEGGFSSSGPCNTRSKSNSDPASCDNEDAADWEDEDAEDEDEGEDDYDDEDEDDDENEDGIDWDDEEACTAELARIDAAMAADRPADAPRLDADDPHGLIADAQHHAFMRGVPRWWLVVPPAPLLSGDAWRYAETGAPASAELPRGGDLAFGEPDFGKQAAPDPTSQPESEPEHEPEPLNFARPWYPASKGRLA